MKSLALAKVYHWIEPGPVLLLVTAHKGQVNLMTMSCHMMLNLEPPQIGCGVGPWDYSFEALRKTRECVLAVPGADLMKKVVAIGNCSGAETDKFSAFHLHAMPAKAVGVPLVAEALANIECRIVDTTQVQRYNLFVAQAVQAWTNPARRDKRLFHANGDGTFNVAGRMTDLKKDMTKWQDMP